MYQEITSPEIPVALAEAIDEEFENIKTNLESKTIQKEPDAAYSQEPVGFDSPLGVAIFATGALITAVAIKANCKGKFFS